MATKRRKQKGVSLLGTRKIVLLRRRTKTAPERQSKTQSDILSVFGQTAHTCRGLAFGQDEFILSPTRCVLVCPFFGF